MRFVLQTAPILHLYLHILDYKIFCLHRSWNPNLLFPVSVGASTNFLFSLTLQLKVANENSATFTETANLAPDLPSGCGGAVPTCRRWTLNSQRQPLLNWSACAFKHFYTFNARDFAQNPSCISAAGREGWDGGAATLLLLSRSNSISRAATGDGETCRGATKDRPRVQDRVHRLPHNSLRGDHISLLTVPRLNRQRKERNGNTSHLQRCPSLDDRHKRCSDVTLAVANSSSSHSSPACVCVVHNWSKLDKNTVPPSSWDHSTPTFFPPWNLRKATESSYKCLRLF